MRKLLLVAIGLCAACAAAEYIVRDAVLLLAAAAAVAAAILLIFKFQHGVFAALLLFSFAAGSIWWFCYGLIFYSPAAALDCKTETVTMTVVEYPTEYEFSAGVFVKLDGSGANAKMRLWLAESYDLKPGDKITAEVLFALPEKSPDFDFLTFSRAKGQFLTGEVVGEPEITRGDSVPVSLWTEKLRNFISNRLDLLFSGEVLGVAKALTIGVRNEMSAPFNLALSLSGLAHIISISGLHITLAANAVLIFSKKKKRAAGLAIALMVLFVLVSGAAPSAIRACVMQTFLLAGMFLNRESDPLTSLSAALIFLLLLNPFAIADVGLQLSFLATLGIVLYSRKMNENLISRIEKSGKVTRFFTSSISLTVVASLFAAPLVAFYFGWISLVSVFANLLVVWVVQFALIFSFAAVAVGFVPVVGTAVVFLARISIEYIIFGVTSLAKLPFSAIDTHSVYNAAWLICAYALLALWKFGPKGAKNGKLSFILAGLALVAALGFGEIDRRLDSAQIDVLNIGQGQAVAVMSGDSSALIDCGGNVWNGAGVVAAEHFLRAGIRQIDTLTLTHYHADHANGLSDLLAILSVRTAFLPDIDDPAAAEIAALLVANGVDINYVAENTDVPLGRGTLTLYRPVRKSGQNEQGLCVLVCSGEFEMLVTGDLNTTSEKILVEREAFPDSEIFIAGHHGSRHSNSDTLLEAITPENVLISVGKNNYGHPAPDTLERFETTGSAVYRTDLGGKITVRVR